MIFLSMFLKIFKALLDHSSKSNSNLGDIRSRAIGDTSASQEVDDLELVDFHVLFGPPGMLYLLAGVIFRLHHNLYWLWADAMLRYTRRGIINGSRLVGVMMDEADELVSMSLDATTQFCKLLNKGLHLHTICNIRAPEIVIMFYCLDCLDVQLCIFSATRPLELQKISAEFQKPARLITRFQFSPGLDSVVSAKIFVEKERMYIYLPLFLFYLVIINNNFF
jgi:superfamily II DNA/RNA helicase